MGGGGFLGLGPAPSAPDAPDYAGAAQQTAAGNLAAARQATAANRVNQITPYGELRYSITGEDPYGNPTWTAYQTLNPQQQRLLDLQNQASIGLGELSGQGLGYVKEMIAQPFNTASLAGMPINAGEQYQEAMLRRLEPTLQNQREALETKLVNQGIPLNSEAYNRAMMQQQQRENDLLNSAITSGFGVGLQARQRGFEELAYQRNEPINTLNAVRSGAQVTGPQFVNSAQQATTSGPDLLSAAQMGYNAQMGNFNAQQAAQSNLNQGLMGLGGAGIMAMCDPRTKENIKAIGVMENGLTIYSFEYKDEFKDREFAGHGVHVGVMADEVEQVYPYAVKTLDDGYKVVDYGLIP
jgi:hypothetical protein